MAARTARNRAATTSTAPTEFLEVDPGQLVVGANVRLDPRLDAEFLASVEERGVLEPVTAYLDPDGNLVVEHGQRRTVAAAKFSRTVPVRVVPPPADVDRVIDQLSTDHRQALTIAERAAGYEQLAAFGLTAEQIAKSTSTPRPVVDAGLAVAKAPAAAKVADEHQLTIEEAAAVAEFADDEQAVAQLVEAAEDGYGFDHAVQRLRDERERDTNRATLEEELRQAGTTVIEPPRWDDKKTAPLHKLLNPAGKELTKRGHAKCPGHAGYATYAGGTAYKAGYACTDWKTNGHTHTEHTRASAVAAGGEADRAAAAAERRDVIASNKAWDSAQSVRRAWLREFLQRKQAPKDAGQFIAQSLANPSQFMVDTAGNHLAHQLLDLGKEPAWGPSAAVQELVAKASPARADLLAVGLLLCAHEAWTNRQHWRHVHEETARYLKFLQAQGYQLSDVELRACGKKSGGEEPSQEPEPAE